MCELLVGLPALVVLGVERTRRLPAGHIESKATVGGGGAIVVIRDRPCVKFEDLSCFGRLVEIGLIRRRPPRLWRPPPLTQPINHGGDVQSSRSIAGGVHAGPSHNERTGTRRPGCRDVLPEPSGGTFTVESKRARSTGPTRRWTVPNAREYGPGASPQCAGRGRAISVSENGFAGWHPAGWCR